MVTKKRKKGILCKHKLKRYQQQQYLHTAKPILSNKNKPTENKVLENKLAFAFV